VVAFDIEHLLTEVTPDAPCGENLEYDPAFIELEQASRGKSEQQFGATIIPGEEPNWADVKRMALELLERARDLRVYDQLLRASLRTDGFIGLGQGLALIRRALEQYWDGLHPQLDPDDDFDPTARVNIVASLCDPAAFLQPVRETPLVSSRSFGRFSLRDMAPDSGSDHMAINAAFQETSVEELQETAAAVRMATEDVRGIERIVTDKVGAGNAADLSALVALLTEAARTLDGRLVARGVGGEAPVEEDTGEAGTDGAPTRQAGAVVVPGEVSSRADVIRMLEKLCEYYARHEPASPVPILLERAKRLVPMSFMDVLQDLIPDAVTMAQVYTGPTANE
jgi:type VI secretion system protein ImpA